MESPSEVPELDSVLAGLQDENQRLVRKVRRLEQAAALNQKRSVLCLRWICLQIRKKRKAATEREQLEVLSSALQAHLSADAEAAAREEDEPDH